MRGACNNLGILYGNGLGVREDRAKAKELFGKACDLGSQLGCDNYKKYNNAF
ncbi:SEL1-like repeat protein [Helicobacter sp.]|uniref:SEL1-like repeat protein n=1 Tax=Helicobacter sp. TaxID=218 RepID=UPI0025C1AB84|nr:SEL1-like repeat protein [Helicobacter sp.]